MKKVVGIILIFILVGAGFWAWNGKSPGKIQIVYEKKVEVQKQKDTVFAGVLEQLVRKQNGDYTIWVMRLTTGESYGFDEQATMPARSAIKVPIILTAFRLGLADKYTQLLSRMGIYSDNNAQEKMIKNLGKDEIGITLSELNMGDTDLEQNITTASDLGKMWKFIYDSSQKEAIAAYLTNSIYEDRIAKGIPEGIQLIHKVGTDVDVWNDSGIILGPKPFILVILNKDVKREEAEKTVPEITKMVWEYEASERNI